MNHQEVNRPETQWKRIPFEDVGWARNALGSEVKKKKY